MQLNNDGTNITWRISHDGRNFSDIYAEAKAAFLGAITQVGPTLIANRNAGIAAGDILYETVDYWNVA
jgi:hypothetical protein